jgi:hypothetical protein
MFHHFSLFLCKVAFRFNIWYEALCPYADASLSTAVPSLVCVSTHKPHVLISQWCPPSVLGFSGAFISVRPHTILRKLVILNSIACVSQPRCAAVHNFGNQIWVTVCQQQQAQRWSELVLSKGCSAWTPAAAGCNIFTGWSWIFPDFLRLWSQ